MNKMRKVSLFLIVFCFIFSTSSVGQIDSFRQDFIEVLSKDINKFYVSAKLAAQMSDSIKLKFAKGGYENTLGSDEFAFEVTKDLRRISKDNHITINALHYDYYVDSVNASKKMDEIFANQRKKQIAKSKKAKKPFDEQIKKNINEDIFAYGDIKILPGNVGYVEILDFESTPSNKKRYKNGIDIATVFKYLESTNSLIIDLRENEGGLTKMAAKFSSYFSSQPNTYFITSQDFIRYDSNGIKKEISVIKKHYTDKTISGVSMKTKAIYILVSNRTFSAAELVAYKVKRFIPQALIIGEQTMGGGNGFAGAIISKYYSAIIPSAKTFDESNNDYNIEGIGITPDIVTTADSAFDIAYSLTCKKQSMGVEYIKYLFKAKELTSTTHFDKSFLEYLGNYNKVIVNQDGGNLYMIYDTFKKCLLSQGKKDFFLSDVFESVQFVRNDKTVIGIAIKHNDGYTENFRKL